MSFESFGTPKSPKAEKEFEYDMEKDGIAWESQPDVRGGYGMPENPSVEGYEVKEEEAPRGVIEGISYERKQIEEDALAMEAIDFDSAPQEKEEPGTGWDDPRSRVAGDLRAQHKEEGRKEAA